MWLTALRPASSEVREAIGDGADGVAELLLREQRRGEDGFEDQAEGDAAGVTAMMSSGDRKDDAEQQGQHEDALEAAAACRD